MTFATKHIIETVVIFFIVLMTSEISIGMDTQAPLASVSGASKDSVHSGPLAQVFFGVRNAFTEHDKSTFGFGLTRTHAGYRHVFDDTWKGVVILDMGSPTLSSGDIGASQLNEGSAHSMTLKFAYVDWTPNHHVSVQFGSILQNHYITQERFWGLRFVEKTFQDLYYHIPSGDLGVIAFTQLTNGIQADLALTNGEGFRRLQDIDSQLKLAGGVSVSEGDFLSRVYASLDGATSEGAGVSMYSVFVGWRSNENLRMGLDLNHLRSDDHGKEISGASFFSGVRFGEGLEGFLRWDFVASEFDDGSPVKSGNAGYAG